MHKHDPQAATPSIPSHDKTMAMKFLAGLDGCAEKFNFQFISDRPGHRKCSSVFHATLEEAWVGVEGFNTPAKALGVFVHTVDDTGQPSRLRLPGTLWLKNPDAPQLYGGRAAWSNGGDPSVMVGEKSPPSPDRSQIETFVLTLFKYATAGNWVSLRVFFQDRLKPFRIVGIRLNDNLDNLIDQAYRVAELAASNEQKLVFSPPVATFTNAKRAREEDLAEGVALSAECDKAANAARIKLETLLGTATVVVASGGEWTNPATGKVEPKLHVHYRLKVPARTKDELKKLKEARRLAAMLVDGDHTNISIVHPIRWPGSIHRKGNPKLCRIVALNPDAEIDLDAALAILQEAAGGRTAGNGADRGIGKAGNGARANPFDGLKVADEFKHLDPKDWQDDGIAGSVDVEARLAAMSYQGDEDSSIHRTQLSVSASMLTRGHSEDEVVARLLAATRQAAEAAGEDGWDWECEEDGLRGMCRSWLEKHPPGGENSPPDSGAERRARQIAENIKIGDDVTEPLLPQIMTLDEMRMRLVFVGSNGAVADLLTGRVRKKEHAADEYAASQHSYLVEKAPKKKKAPAKKKQPEETPEPEPEPILEKKGGPALKFWMASRDRKSVEVLAWVPGAGAICPPPEGPGPAFNMWRGLPPMAYPANWQERVKPFLEHVAYLVPIEVERERFLNWLAHIVKVPEVLPHTSYLMITPTTGVGRNLLASILVRVLRGFVAAGVSLPEMLDGGFTGRLSMKLLVTVDEAREGRGERRYDRAERFKRLQTEEHRRINAKYGFDTIEKNCGRWLKFSQHNDAIPFDNSDRRVIVIANPTIRKPDAYYERLYGLLDDKDFIGSVRHWLETKDITAFRPGEHAPMNQAKLRALDDMMSETERGVTEFREDCKTELTSRDAIKTYVTRADTFFTVNDMHLTHAIRQARMVNTGRRIVGYKKYDNNHTEEKRFTVVIVRGEWTPETVKKADAQKLLEAMGLGDWSTVKPAKPQR